MATGGQFSVSLSKSSEEIHDFPCTLCHKEGFTVEAVKQCFDCNEFFCRTCIRFHNRIVAMSTHNVVDKKEMRNVPSWKPTIPLPTQTCNDHHGERITTYCVDHDALCCKTCVDTSHNHSDTYIKVCGERITKYCADHDVICCNTCVDSSHKNCDGITYIVDVAHGITSDDQFKTTKVNIAATLNDLTEEMVVCKKYMATLDNDRTTNMQQVKDFTERLIKRIRELEKITISQIDSHHKEQSDKAVEDITHLDGAISVMEEDLKNLDQSQQNSESTVFVDVRLGQRHEAEGLEILQHVNAHRKTGSTLVLNTSLEPFLNDLTTFENLVDDSKMCTAKLKGDYNIKVQQDTDTCNILGSCHLPDGTVVVTDYMNKRLKRLDASNRVTDHCNMPHAPWGVTCTAPDEVAVTLTTLKMIQFVSVRDNMSMTRSFSTSDMCRGICYSAGELFVSCGGLTKKGFEEGPGHVAVFSLNGDHLRTLHNDPSGKQIFSLPYHITASPDGARIYVADYEGGVVSSDRSEKSVCYFTDPSLNHAMGLCTLDNGHLLVCGRQSHNVLEFDGDGRKVATLLRDTDDIKEPRSLSYDSHNARLVVTMKNTDTIKVFDLA